MSKEPKGPADILWQQYDAFNYPKAEDIIKRHCREGNHNWQSFPVEEWQKGIEKAKRRAKEMDLNTATRLLQEPQTIYTDGVLNEYEDGLLVAIDNAQHLNNINHRNLIMRHICERCNIPNLQTLRSFIDTQR